MADSFLEQLERQKQLARESADEYEKGIALSKEIARLKAEKVKHQQTIVKNLESTREKVGTIDRFGSALGAFSPTDALHKLNQDLFTVQEQHKNWSNTLVNAHKTVVNFQKNYAKSVFNNLRTAATGEDYNKDFKRYSDIIYEQMGIQKKKGFQVADIAGFAGDVGTDLGNIVSPVKIAYQSFQSIGTQAVKIASRAPKIKTLIDTMGRNIDVFHDISKVYSEKTLFDIKMAMKEAVGSGDFSRLQALRNGWVKDSSGAVSKWKPATIGGMSTERAPLDKFLLDMFPEQFGQTIKTGKPSSIISASQQSKGILSDTLKPLVASVGRALEVTNQGYKWLMTWSPRFQTRNIAGATFQNVSEYSTKEIVTGRFLKDYIEAFKVVWNKGVDKQTGEFSKYWTTMQKYGEIGVEGIGGQGAAKLPKTLATFNENVQRYVSVLRETRYGKNVDQAVVKTSNVLYEYNQKYMTPFMKEVGKVVPFLAYNVGQLKYMPDALQRLASKYNFLTKLDKNTQDSFLKENPQLTPDYQKDQFMVGNIGNFGIQAEGFLRLFTGGIKDGMREAWGQLAPLFSGAIELATNWKVFEGKKLAEDTSTKKYQDSFILSTLAGDPFRTGEGNAYLKFAVEKFAGPLLSSIQKMFDSKSPWYSGFTSVRAYDNDPAGLRRIAGAEAAAEKQGGWFAVLKERFGFGPGTANAAPLNVTIDSGDPVSKSASAEIQAWSKRNAGGRDVFGKEYVWGAGYEQTMFRQQTARWAAAEARNALNAGPDIGANFMQYSRVIIDDLLNDARWTGRQNDPEFKRIFDSTQQMLEWMRPRMRTEEGQFSSELLALYRRSMGKEATDIAFNKAQEDWVAFIGKTADMLRAAAGTSLESIIKTAQAEKLALGAQTGSGNVQYSDREIAARRYAIDAAAEEKIRKLEGRANVATSNILTAWANGTANELEKLNYLKEAAYKKFLGSDDYKSFVEDKVNGEQQFQAWRAAFEREWDYKISQQRVKEIESYLKQVKAMAQGEAEEIVAALEAAFARGGVSINEYFQTKIQADTQASIKTFEAIVDVFKAQMQSIPEVPYAQPSEPKYNVNQTRAKAFKPTIDQATFMEIVDGDTVLVRTSDGKLQKVRLAYVDTPETAHLDINRFAVGQPGGEEAKNALANYLKAGDQITLKGSGTSYGRLVAEIFKDNISVNWKLIEDGWASYLAFFAKNKEEFEQGIRLQTEAQMKKAGIWGIEGNDPLNYQSPFEYRKAITAALETGIAPDFSLKREQTEVIAKRQQYNEAVKQLDELLAQLSDPSLNFEKVKEIYTSLINAMTSFKESGNIVELQQTLVAAINEATSLAQQVDKNAQAQISAQQQLDAAISELQRTLAKTRIEVAKIAGGQPLFGDKRDWGTKFGKSVSPYGDADPGRAEYKENLIVHDYTTAAMLNELNQELRGGFESGQQIGESPAAYSERLEKIITFESQREQITIEAETKIAAIKDLAVERDRIAAARLNEGCPLLYSQTGDMDCSSELYKKPCRSG